MRADFLEARLKKRKEQGILRALQPREKLIDLTSNDYFGFASSLELLEKINGLGATGSRLLTGNHLLYEELEESIARFHKAESCVIYNTGYTANLGLLQAIGTSEVTFLYDLEIHASMIDGMALSQAKSRPFRHNDLCSLEGRLKEASLPVFVLVESIYSMSGDFAPLTDIAALCTKYGAGLIVDEAHATGICGPQGKGRVVECGLEEEVFARLHTFSKALGIQGACVLGSCTLKEYLINFSRALIYTTALPVPALFWIRSSYKKLQREAEGHQERLRGLVAYFQEKFSLFGSPTPIQPVYVSGAEKARLLSQKLRQRGLDVRAVVSPTTKRGKECLRVVLHSFNREEEVDTLFEALR